MVESTCIVYICFIHFFYSYIFFKTILLHYPEKLIALHHAGFAIAMFQMNEFTIAKFLCPVWHVFGHDVGVDVDFHWRRTQIIMMIKVF